MPLLRRLAAWFDSTTERSAVVEECEPRILYSADLNPAMWSGAADTAGTGAIVGSLDPAPGPSSPERSAVQQQQGRHEIVFVDTRVQNYEQLIDGIDAEAEVVLLERNRDGIDQIAAHLRGRTGIDAVHLIGEGNTAELHLGTAFVTQEALDGRYADLLAKIGQSLSPDADLLIYGCNFGQGEAGLAAMQTMARLTGADVAASTDRTGHVAQYGDWELERAVGGIETDGIVGAGAQAAWQGSLATYTVTNENDSGAGSLRQAILDANASVGTDNIFFNIADTGWNTIRLSAALPTITDTVILDATTDNSFAVNGNQPAIILDGENATGGLVLGSTADGSTIRGLVIRDFAGDGIQILAGSDNNTIVGNYIGRLDGNGLDAGVVERNGGDGILVLGASNTIGGTVAADRNVIAGNQLSGIGFSGASATGNVVLGNYIGTDATGTAALGNAGDGVSIRTGAANNTIGGTVAGARNVISGNTLRGVHITFSDLNEIVGNYIGTDVSGTAAIGNGREGVRIDNGSEDNTVAGNVLSGNTEEGIYIVTAATTGNVVRGNYIGTDASGTAGLGNGLHGVGIDGGASGNLIGGTTAADRNVISGNASYGVAIVNSSGNALQGNYIGTNAAGTAAIANSLGGVLLDGSANNGIGDGTANTRNLISGNTGSGVLLRGVGTTGNAVDGNFIGTNAAGTTALGNSGDGIRLEDGAANNRIGGPFANQGNRIAFNGANGIAALSTAGTGNNFVRNSIHSNTLLGIDLGNDGVTANDAGDADTGANNTQNFPLLTDVRTNEAGQLFVTGTLNTIAGRNYRIEVFSNTTGDASGHGEGQTFVGAFTVTTDAAGNVAFNRTLAATVPIGAVISATATHAPDGSSFADSSEFSQNFVAISVNRAPVNTVPGAQSVAEDSQLAFTGGATISVNDLDANLVSTRLAVVSGVLTVSLAGGATVSAGTNGSNTLTLAGTQAQINAALATLTYQGNADFNGGDTLTVLSTDGDGATGSDTVAITVTNVNDAPVLDNTGAMTLTSINEDATTNAGRTVAQIIASAGGNRITDVDAAAVEGIAITSLSSGNGTWQFSTNGGTSWNDVGAVSDTSALLLRATDRLRFVPDARNADSATVSFRAWDQTSGTTGTKTDASTNGGTTAFSALVETASITVTAVNDVPVLDNTGTMTFTPINEEAANNGGNTVAEIIASAGGDRITDVDDGAVEGIAVVGTASGNGTWQYSLDDGGSWSNVGTVTGSASLLLRAEDRVRFVPDGMGADTASVSFRAWDQSAGTAGTKIVSIPSAGIGAQIESASITVAAVNDAPVLDNTGAMTLPTINEDAITATNTGSLVSQIIASAGGNRITDVDAGALEGIAITSLDSGNGTWQFSTNGGTSWSSVGAVSDTSALLLRATDRLRFVPDGQNADAATVNFRAWDQTSGSTGTKVDASVNGGATAFSTATEAASITVTAVNDSPVVDNGGTMTFTTIDEDAVNNSGNTIAEIIASAGGDRITDVDDGALEGIALESLNAGNGTWQYSLDDGGTWSNVGAVSNLSALLLGADDRLRFVPGGANADAASIFFRAWDQTSGTAGTKVSASTLGGTAAISIGARTASITVTAVNDAPAITSNGGGAAASVNVAENTTAVTTVTATDADLPAQTLTYSITGGADAARFAIDAATGALRFVSAPDFEVPADTGANNVYDVIVQASDGTLTDTQAIAVTVTAVNDSAPVITSNGGGAAASVNVAENTSAVTTVTATDADLPAQTFTYAITGGADAARFAIDAATGALRFVSAPNFEAPGDAGADNTYDVIVQASDGTLTDSQAIAVVVTPVNNNAPVITSNGGGATAAVSITENSTAVTTITATDSDLPSQTLAYSIAGGADAARFTIDAATGALVFASAPNHESPIDAGADNTYDVVVRVSDGTFADTQALAVTVSNVNEAPDGLSPSSVRIEDKAPPGTVVATVVASDPDTGESFSYALVQDAAGRFSIDPNTGRIVVAPGAVLDYSAQASFELRVRVTDAAGLGFEQSLRVALREPTQTDPGTVPPPMPAPEPPPPPPTTPPDSSVPPAPPPADPDPETTPPAGGDADPTAPGDGEGEDGDGAGVGGIDPLTPGADEPEVISPGGIGSSLRLPARDRDGVGDLAASVSFGEFTLGDAPPLVAMNWNDTAIGSTGELSLRSAMLLARDTTIEAEATGTNRGGDDTGNSSSIAEAARDPIRVASVTFTAGFVWWLTRSGGLITTMLMGVPAWRHVDLLPVLAQANDDDDDEDDGNDGESDDAGNSKSDTSPTDHEDSAVAELFEAEASARHSVIR